MPAGCAPFTADEYERRLGAVRLSMAQQGLDALIVTDPSNMSWLTGYDGWSFYVHQAVILTPFGSPIWWGRQMDAFGARRTVWMDQDKILAYADHFVQSNERHPMQDLAAHLQALGLTRARIGVEMENYYYSAKAHAVLGSALTLAKLCDATGLVNWCRLVKSPPELVYMRKAALIAEAVVQTALDHARPGLRKNQLVAEIMHKAITGVGEDWGDYPAIVPLTPSGADASAAHLTWNGAPMRSGEATFFELAGCYRRYHVPLCRTIHLGPPPDAMRRAEAAQLEGITAGLDAARAGNAAGDIATAFQDALRRHGIPREGRCGYSVGLSYPPDWGERTLSIRPEDRTPLEPGMTLHFMPALWMENWGLETTETILIRDSGPAEPLCNLPRQLFVHN